MRNVVILLIGIIAAYLITKKFLDKGMGIYKGSYFTWKELTTTNTGLPNIPNSVQRNNLSTLVRNVLDPIRILLGKPVFVNSGFRSMDVNKKVGGASTSQHLYGNAADIRINGNLLDAFNNIRASNIPYDQLIYEQGKNGTWIHVSYSPPPQRRQALLAYYNQNTGKMDYTKA